MMVEFGFRSLLLVTLTSIVLLHTGQSQGELMNDSQSLV